MRSWHGHRGATQKSGSHWLPARTHWLNFLTYKGGSGGQNDTNRRKRGKTHKSVGNKYPVRFLLVSKGGHHESTENDKPSTGKIPDCQEVVHIRNQKRGHTDDPT